MISGRDTLAAFDSAISEARAGEGRLDAVLASATAEAQRLRSEQTDAYRALARLRLDAIAAQAVDARLDSAERRALQLMETARKALADLAARRDAATAEVARLDADQRAAETDLDAVEDEIAALARRTADASGHDADWRGARDRLAEAERIADEAAKKAETATADRVTKGAPYEGDPLFMYLWRNGFGTSAYRAGNVARFFDRKVAALVGYQDARPNYAMLIEIPARLTEHAERRRAEVEAARSALAAVERSKLEAAGVGPLDERRAAAVAVRDRIAAAAKLARDHLAALDQELALARSGSDKGGYAEALDLIAGELAQDDIRDLLAAAARTPDAQDDRLVRRIAELAAAIRKCDAEIAETRARAREMAGRRGELEAVREDFRRRGWDQPQVAFGNERIIGEMIGGLIGGVLTSPDLWRVLTEGYTTRPRHTDSGGGYGGGPRFPMPGGMDDGPRGGNEAPRGGGGGDGFRTGGGF